MNGLKKFEPQAYALMRIVIGFLFVAIPTLLSVRWVSPTRIVY